MLLEFDGVIDMVVFGGLCGDNIYFIRERVFAFLNCLK